MGGDFFSNLMRLDYLIFGTRISVSAGEVRAGVVIIADKTSPCTLLPPGWLSRFWLLNF